MSYWSTNRPSTPANPSRRRFHFAQNPIPADPKTEATRFLTSTNGTYTNQTIYLSGLKSEKEKHQHYSMAVFDAVSDKEKMREGIFVDSQPIIQPDAALPLFHSKGGVKTTHQAAFERPDFIPSSQEGKWAGRPTPRNTDSLVYGTDDLANRIAGARVTARRDLDIFVSRDEQYKRHGQQTFMDAPNTMGKYDTSLLHDKVEAQLTIPIAGL